MAAAALWLPDGVFTGRAAALVTFWSDIRIGTITMALGGHRRGRDGFRVERRLIAPEDVTRVQGLRVTRAALTAIDLVRETGTGDPIDVALRSRWTTIKEIQEVFDRLPHRRDNRLCAQLIHESRDEPWSPPERSLHRLLHGAGITGWVANKAVTVGAERRFADVRFDGLMLAIEVDGYEVHSRRETFEEDRVRQNAFALDGWPAPDRHGRCSDIPIFSARLSR